jgi:hypothetical protein
MSAVAKAAREVMSRVAKIFILMPGWNIKVIMNSKNGLFNL